MCYIGGPRVSSFNLLGRPNKFKISIEQNVVREGTHYQVHFFCINFERVYHNRTWNTLKFLQVLNFAADGLHDVDMLFTTYNDRNLFGLLVGV